MTEQTQGQVLRGAPSRTPGTAIRQPSLAGARDNAVDWQNRLALLQLCTWGYHTNDGRSEYKHR
jgi:hypothetical protein